MSRWKLLLLACIVAGSAASGSVALADPWKGENGKGRHGRYEDRRFGHDRGRHRGDERRWAEERRRDDARRWEFERRQDYDRRQYGQPRNPLSAPAEILESLLGRR